MNALATRQRAVPGCETEIARILDRRQRLRGGPPFAPVTLERLVEGARALIAARTGAPCIIEDPRWLSGGTSKLQIAFRGVFADGTARRMVLRMEPAESLVETSRLREFEVTRALAGELPMADALFLDAEGEHLPYPTAIYGLVAGVASPTDAEEKVSGMGLNFGKRLRPIIAEQFIAQLAHLHTLDPAAFDLPSFQIPRSAAQAAQWQISWWERIWEEDRNFDVPLVRTAIAWLRNNLPDGDRYSIVHGDFRNGNFLFDEHSGRITAILDWEMAHIGDRHEDVAYLIQRAYGHFSEDGSTYLVCGIASREEFLERYEAATGLAIDPGRLRFYEVLNLVKCAAITRATGPCVVRLGKTHQDATIAYANGISYLLMEELRLKLEEVL